MKDIATVRMVTIHFSALQGLKMVPLGLLLLVVSLWANAHTGPARDFLLPGGSLLLACFLYLFITHYYNMNFGSVSPGPRKRSQDVIEAVVGGAAALSAFLVDGYLRPPFSAIGLLLAGLIAAGYYRLTWNMPRVPWLFFYELAAFLLLVALSLLPILGVDWWHPIGIKAMMLGTTTLGGLLLALTGVLAHLYLLHWLPAVREDRHEQRI